MNFKTWMIMWIFVYNDYDFVYLQVIGVCRLTNWAVWQVGKSRCCTLKQLKCIVPRAIFIHFSCFIYLSVLSLLFSFMSLNGWNCSRMWRYRSRAIRIVIMFHFSFPCTFSPSWLTHIWSESFRFIWILVACFVA